MSLRPHFIILAEPEVAKNAIITSIKEPSTFSEQISLLQAKLQVDKAKIEAKRKLIYNDLHTALAYKFPSHEIHFFGSSITGLDVQGSDLDVYIENVRDSHKPDVVTLKTLRFLIFKSRKFCDVLLIPAAKVPIIKCIHTKTQICCDINVKNKVSVQNSKLIKYYLNLDDKIRPLMIFIKFWAEHYDLKKVNFFSSYALYMMVIFYLQQEPYKLPTVFDLQKNIQPEIIDGWNCAFNPIEFSSPALKNATILDLTLGFFRFYGEFDYITNVISPYCSTEIDKVSFLKPFNLPECYQIYNNQKLVLPTKSGICVQDPFEHARNVTSSVPLLCTGKFTNLCRIAVKIIEKGEKELLHKLITNNSVTVFGFVINKTGTMTDEEWISSVKEITVKLITDILKLNISTKQNFGTDSVTYNAVGTQNIWDNRINILKNLLTQLPPETNEIEREIAVTTCILKYFPQNLFTGLCLNLTFKKNPMRVEVLLRQVGKAKHFFHVYHFINMRLVKFVNLIETRKVILNAETNPNNVNSMEIKSGENSPETAKTGPGKLKRCEILSSQMKFFS